MVAGKPRFSNNPLKATLKDFFQNFIESSTVWTIIKNGPKKSLEENDEKSSLICIQPIYFSFGFQDGSTTKF